MKFAGDRIRKVEEERGQKKKNKRKREKETKGKGKKKKIAGEKWKEKKD